jgi:hypothetical protein
VFDVLKTHMSIQDELFRPTMRKIIRIPGFYRPVPYDERRDALRKLSEELLEIRTRIRGMKPEGDTENGRFLISLRAYCSSLSEAILALSDICGRLADKSHGGDYPRASYEKEVDAFRALEAKSMEIGKTLNRLNRKDASGKTAADISR